MLRLRSDAWLQRQDRVGYHATSAALTALKKTPDHTWLNDVSSVRAQQALRHLQTAFSNFFARRALYPSFKRKNGPQSAEYTTSAFRWDGKVLRLAKMNKALNVRWSRALLKAAKITTATASKDAAGRYCVSLLCEDAVTPKPAALGNVGIARGLSHFAILSTGEKVVSPKTFRKNEARLAKWPRRLKNTKLGSKNRAKVKHAVARVHAHITDARRNFLHKLDPSDQRKPSDRRRDAVREHHAAPSQSGEVDQRCRLVGVRPAA